MNRNEVVIWLNRRLEYCNTQRVLHFDDADYIFIRNYIHHYKGGKLVDFETILNSLQYHQSDVIVYLDNMINKLLIDFKINTSTKKKKVQDPRISMSIGRHPFEVLELDFIEKYS